MDMSRIQKLHKIFTEYHKTHNQGVFDIYTPEMMKARHCKIITGLPDTYGRGRIVGDYRRVALYGIDYLMAEKKKDFANTQRHGMRDEDFRLREEITDQYQCIKGYERNGCRFMASIFLSRLRMQEKLVSGYISDTLQQSRHRTVLQCP